MLLAFAGGLLVRGFFAHDPVPVSEGESAADFYSCSMHPQIRQPGPGKCPICAMDLIPVSRGQDDGLGPRELVMSPRAVKLAEIETVPVVRRHVTAELRMVGKVEYDETRLSTITARVPGRLDRLYVDYTGIEVKEGDHLVKLYSPELLQAQEELLSALKTSNELRDSANEYLKERTMESVISSREKLRLWGLTEEQIQEIETRGNVNDHMTLFSPVSGIVVNKNAVEGMYVQTGTEIYSIANLSRVWVKLDAYETDLPWLHYGQEVEFITQAYPGEVFRGQIAFIDPVLNARTRTVKIRVNLPNPEGRLKPDMFVRAVVKSQIAKQGRVMNPELAGKWISPMHPEIIKDQPGECDICGMDLVSAESLGYVSAETDTAPLVIPKTAPLITGKRAVVYIDKGRGKYEGREIVLGQRAGDFYLVESGLEEGEEVVVKGNFKIDSAIQIQARPSMMNPDEGSSDPTMHTTEGIHPAIREIKPIPVPESFLHSWRDLIDVYLQIKDDLSHDRLPAMEIRKENLTHALEAINGSDLPDEAQEAWAQQLETFQSTLQILGEATTIVSVRDAFEPFSNQLILAVKQFGADQDLFLFHCPMAFKGRGGYWIQDKEGTENPYYGSSMFSCGDLVKPLTDQTGHEGHHHE